jgi:hypothetical protein
MLLFYPRARAVFPLKIGEKRVSITPHAKDSPPLSAPPAAATSSAIAIAGGAKAQLVGERRGPVAIDDRAAPHAAGPGRAAPQGAHGPFSLLTQCERKRHQHRAAAQHFARGCGRP